MQKRLKYVPRAERHKVQVIGKLTLEKGMDGGGAYLCNTLNMSLSGALVETSSVIPVGSVLHYTFSLPGLKNLIEVTGEVMRKEGRLRRTPSGSKTGGESSNTVDSAQGRVKLFDKELMTCYGIKFLDIREEDKKAIKDFLVS